MIDREFRRRLVDLAIVAVCALAVAAAFRVVAENAADRHPQAPEPSVTPEAVASTPSVAPVPGLQPAPRKIIRRVVRRSRPS